MRYPRLFFAVLGLKNQSAVYSGSRILEEDLTGSRLLRARYIILSYPLVILLTSFNQVAQLGLQSAIAIGDLRIIQSLQWVGLHEKLDVQCLIWAMQNAGGGRLMVLKALLEMHLLCQKGLKRIQSFKDKDKFQLALYKEKDDAERTSDIATLQLLEGIEESLTFKLWDVDLRSYPNFCGYYLINPEHEVLQEI